MRSLIIITVICLQSSVVFSQPTTSITNVDGALAVLEINAMESAAYIDVTMTPTDSYERQVRNGSALQLYLENITLDSNGQAQASLWTTRIGMTDSLPVYNWNYELHTGGGAYLDFPRDSIRIKLEVVEIRYGEFVVVRLKRLWKPLLPLASQIVIQPPSTLSTSSSVVTQAHRGKSSELVKDDLTNDIEQPSGMLHRAPSAVPKKWDKVAAMKKATKKHTAEKRRK